MGKSVARRELFQIKSDGFCGQTSAGNPSTLAVIYAADLVTAVLKFKTRNPGQTILRVKQMALVQLHHKFRTWKEVFLHTSDENDNNKDQPANE